MNTTNLVTAARRIALCLVPATATVTHAQALDPSVFIRTFPNAAQGYVSAMTINDDGTLDLVGAWPTSDTGPQSLSLSQDGQFLAVAHGTAANSERLDVFAVDPDGSLTYLSSTIVPNSPLGLAWLNPETLAVTETSFGADNSVGVYRWDPIAQTLTEIDREYTGRFNSEIIRHPHGLYLVANDTTTNTIRVFEIDEAGELTIVESQSTNGIYQFGFGFDDHGERIYAGGGISGGGSVTIGYEFDSITGALDPIPGSPFFSPGSSPNEVDVAEGDQWAYVSHGTDATLRSFRVEADGALTSAGYSFDIGMQGSLGQADTFHDLVFVTDNTTAIDGKSGIYSFRIDQSDGRLTMIGSDLYSTGSSTPDGIEIWDPAAGIYLEIGEVRRGQRSEFRATNATPGEPVGLAYSVVGPGSTFVPRIGVSLGIENPVQAGDIERANANGVAIWDLPIPQTSVDNVWFQSAQVGRVSNIVQRRVR